jgi:hypothetical protein
LEFPKSTNFNKSAWIYYCYHRDISPHLRVEGTWTTTEIEITDLPINPTFAAKADVEFIEPMEN